MCKDIIRRGVGGNVSYVISTIITLTIDQSLIMVNVKKLMRHLLMLIWIWVVF